MAIGEGLSQKQHEFTNTINHTNEYALSIPMPKVIFDTNFWSYLANSGRSRDFRDLEGRKNLIVLLPPSILLEASRTKNSDIRKSILSVICQENRVRMRTEADLESEELVNEVRRLRPSCINFYPNTKRIKTLREFWTNEIWRGVLSQHEFLHHEARKMLGDSNTVLNEQSQLKNNLSKWSANKTLPSNIKAQFPLENDHYKALVAPDQWYEPWRIDSLLYYNNMLKIDQTIIDWTAPWININLFLSDKKALFNFWLHDVSPQRMPRNYTRWAMNLLQSLRKLGEGNPFDAQHTTYLHDSELFFTCDRRYFDCLKVIFEDGVVPIARPVLLPADIESALRVISSEV